MRILRVKYFTLQKLLDEPPAPDEPDEPSYTRLTSCSPHGEVIPFPGRTDQLPPQGNVRPWMSFG